MIARRALPLLALPGLVRAQRRIPVIGFIGFSTLETDRISIAAFREGMQAQAMPEGRAWRLEQRDAGGDVARGHAMIRDLAALPVDVFVAPGPASARAVRRATNIPVVAVALPPVRSDPELFASLARPGGSVTGFASFGEEMSAKRLELLRELMPDLPAVGVMHNAADPTFDGWGNLTEQSAREQGLRTLRVPLTDRDPEALRGALARMETNGAQALIVVRDFLTSAMMADIIAAALPRRIAVVGELARFAEAGALFTYGANMPDLFRRAAGYVVRILRGERPAELPVQLPTAIELALNLRTARALNVSVPPTILARADEVIE